MDITILLLLGLGLAVAVPFLSDDGDDDDDVNEIRGTLGDDDPLNGTSGNDNILAFDGDDTINAGAGRDFVNAGLGNDTVFGGDDRDEIEGRAGDDMLFGEGGSDTLLGGAGDDRLDGGLGTDIIRGGRGADVILGGPHAEIVNGEFVPDNDPGDTLRGEGGEDEIYLWGRDGLAVGGQNSDDPGTGDEKDELVLVTGIGTLEDSEGTTDFFALANIEDAQNTRAFITEFDPNEHRMILTIDIDPGQTATPDIDFTLTQTEIDGVNGVLVEAVLVNEDDFDDGSYEEASAFFRGAILPDPVPADLFDIEVVVTDAADYFDPEATVEFIKGQIPAT